MKKFFLSMSAMVLSFFVLFGCSNDVDNSSLILAQLIKGNTYSGPVANLSVSAEVLDSTSRAIYVSDIQSAKAIVEGFDSKGEAFSKESPLVSVSSGKGSGITVSSIPVCKNAVVTVKAYADAKGIVNLDGIVISQRVDINQGENNSATVSWNTSKEGNVYAALIKAGVNTNTLTDTQKSSIAGAIPTDIHAALIDAGSIASDYKSNSLKSSSSYKLTAGTVKVTCNDYDGCTLQVNDPVSSTGTAVKGSVVTISNVAPGTWTLYVLDGTTVKTSKSVVVTSGNEASVTLGSSSFDGIQIQVAKSLGYSLIHYWSCSDKTKYPNTSWPGTAMLTDWCDDDYIYNFEGCSSVNLLIVNSNENKLCSNDIKITEKGAYRITSSGASKSTYISDVPPEPELPGVSITPEESTVATNVKIKVTLNNGNDNISAATVTITGVKNKSYSYSDFTNDVLEISVSDLTSESGKTISVAASVTNSVGTTTDTQSYTTYVNEVSLVSNFNQLTMFQVMVSHFQDGDNSIGYTNAYGPSGQTYGGDLQGIINSLDYLQDLGINALWMTPIFNSNSSNSGDQMGSTGYYTYDYFNIDPRFGTNAKFAELVEECHNRGINVILDGVVGHWGADVAASPSGKKPTRSNGQYKGCDYPASLDFFKEVLSYWIENYDIDGWRLDQAYQAGARTDEVYTGGVNYWPQLRATVEAAAATNGTKGQDWGTLGYMCGEVLDGDQSNIQNWVVVNDGLQSNFDFPSRYKLCNAIVGGSDWANSAGSDTFKDAMTYTYNTYGNKGYTHSKGYYPNLFFSNHDLLRFGDLIIDWKGYSYGSDNYVGKYKVALAAMASYTGPITLYMGDEWGEATQGISLITSLSTPVGKGAYWDNSSRTSGRIDKATNGSAAEKEVLAYTKKLLAARKAHKALWNGTSTVQSTSSSDFFVTKKVCDGETIYVCINNSTSNKSFSLSGTGTDLISGDTFTGTVTVPALSARYILVK